MLWFSTFQCPCLTKESVKSPYTSPIPLPYTHSITYISYLKVNFSWRMPNKALTKLFLSQFQHIKEVEFSDRNVFLTKSYKWNKTIYFLLHARKSSLVSHQLISVLNKSIVRSIFLSWENAWRDSYLKMRCWHTLQFI